MSNQITASKHFQWNKPYTQADLLSKYKQYQFRAKLAPDANGVSEEITITSPIMHKTGNHEVTCMEILPAVMRARDNLHWTWSVTFTKMTNCLDQDLVEIWNKIVTDDYNTNALKTANNFKACTGKMIAKCIGRDYPRDDVLELLETGVKKSLEMTPTQLWDRLKEMNKMAAILPGTVTVPNDDVLKSYFLRALPQSMKEQMFLSGLNQQSRPG